MKKDKQNVFVMFPAILARASFQHCDIAILRYFTKNKRNKKHARARIAIFLFANGEKNDFFYLVETDLKYYLVINLVNKMTRRIKVMVVMVLVAVVLLMKLTMLTNTAKMRKIEKMTSRKLLSCLMIVVIVVTWIQVMVVVMLMG